MLRAGVHPLCPRRSLRGGNAGLAVATAIAIGATALLPAPAAAEARRPYGGTVVASLLSEPVSFDPVEARSYAEVTVVSLVYDTLYEVDASGRVTPHLALGAPALSADGLSARIEVRGGVTFQDGRALTPADVARSLARVQHSDRGWLLAGVSAISAHGDAVVIALDHPVPDLAERLAAPETAVTPDGQPPRGDRVIGSGPFRLVAVDRAGRRLVLAAYDDHFAGRPYVDKLELGWFVRASDEARRYEAGRADLSLRGDVAFAGHVPKYATAAVEGPAGLLVYLGFGSAHPRLLADRDFRRAVSLALSRRGLRNIGAGERVQPTPSPVPAAFGGPPVRAHALTAAPRRAARALRRGAASVPALRRALAGRAALPLEVIVDATRPDDRAVGGKVVAALFRLGLRARVTVLGARAFARRVRAGACDFYVGQLVPPAPTATLAMTAAFLAGGDRWPLSASGTFTLGRAAAAFRRQLPIVPLYDRSIRVDHRKQVRGVAVGIGDRISFADLYLFGAPQPTLGTFGGGR